MPMQGRSSGIEADIVIASAFYPAASDIRPGDRIWVLTWFHLAERDRLRGHPRGDVSRPKRGVFSLRSPARPNPISMTLVDVIEAEEGRLRVRGLEAVDQTPVLDIKPYIPEVDS